MIMIVTNPTSNHATKNIMRWKEPSSILVLVTHHGVQGWRNGESNRLSPTWPGFDSQIRRQMWVEFVNSLVCTERFSPGTPVSPLLKKPKFDLIVLRWFPHNIRAIMAKIKLPKNPLSMVIFGIKVRRSYRDLSSRADRARENWTWSYPYFS